MKINDLFLKDSYELNPDVIDSIHELQALKGISQNQKYHTEGDAFTHTKMCVDCIANMVYTLEMVDFEDIDIKCIIAAVLFHDLGKAKTTFMKDNVYHAYGHEFESEKLTRRLLWDEEIKYREKVCGLVRNHMMPLDVLYGKSTLEKIAALSMSPYYTLSELYFVKKADLAGTMYDGKAEAEMDLEIFRRFVKRMNCEKYPFSFFLTSDMPYFRHIRKMLYKEDYHKDMPVINVHMMIGLPGSGKSTWVERQLKTIPNSVIISRDIMRAELGFCEPGEKCVLDSDREELVTKACNDAIIKAVNERKEIIIDNMHTKKKYRDNVKELLKSKFPKFNFMFHYVYCETSLENCLERRPMISKEVYNGMIYSIDWPDASEYHNMEVWWS